MSIIQNVAELRNQGLECARNIAEYYVRIQNPYTDFNPGAGSFCFTYDQQGAGGVSATQWVQAFAAMGLFSAARVFDDKRYFQAAEKMGEQIKTLQIFDPFLQKHYGALREHTPQTTWCYVRDGLSGAWSFIEFYRETKKEEYLDRAILWAEWYLREGQDEDGWPLWGIDLEQKWRDGSALMRNDVVGDFHGGCLNFFYQLYKATGDKKWIGDFFTSFAARFVKYVQQTDGYYRTILKNSLQVPNSDPQGGLHKSNDDLSSLGLLCAYRVTNDYSYIMAVEKFLGAVQKDQDVSGFFEKSVAGIPVVLNTILEAEAMDVKHNFSAQAEQNALKALFSRQLDGSVFPLIAGGINELNDGCPCSRSSAYALIVLLKLFAGESIFLASQE